MANELGAQSFIDLTTSSASSTCKLQTSLLSTVLKHQSSPSSLGVLQSPSPYTSGAQSEPKRLASQPPWRVPGLLDHTHDAVSVTNDHALANSASELGLNLQAPGGLDRGRPGTS